MMLNKYLNRKTLKINITLLSLIIIFYLSFKKTSISKLSSNPVEIAEVTNKDMSFVTQLGGAIKPFETVIIKSQVNGRLRSGNSILLSLF